MGNNTNAPVINIALLRKVMEHIENHPEEWQQSVWRTDQDNRCGTAMCFAGHAAHIGGCEWADQVMGFVSEHVIANEADREWVEQCALATIETRKGVPMIHAAFRAQRLLGLTDAQRGELFLSGNSLADLRAIVDRFEREAFE